MPSVLYRVTYGEHPLDHYKAVLAQMILDHWDDDGDLVNWTSAFEEVSAALAAGDEVALTTMACFCNSSVLTPTEGK